MDNVKFQKIDASDLDYNKIYTNSNDAYNNTNNVKVNEDLWEEMDLSLETLDNGTQRIYNGDVAIGFTNQNIENNMSEESIINKNEENQNNTTNVKQNYENNISVSKNTTDTTPISNHQVNNNSSSNNNIKIYKHDESNRLAQYAREMGMTDDQIDIAVGISRWETGNYKHLAYGYNYGGVTGSGDLGSEGGYAKYSSEEVGMKSYLDNLQRNYFDQGLNTTEQIARKYLGYSDTSSWIAGVNGCKK